MIFIPLLLLGIFSLSFQPSAAADKIRIGYSGATVSNAMLWVTDEGKLFQKNGVDPQILYLQTTLGQTAMIAGEIDMCVYSGSLLSSARLQGVDVVMVASFLNRPLYRLVVRPEIRTVADLKGKRLGVFRFGSNNHYFALQTLPRYGLDPNRDVILRQTTGGVGDVAALVNGSLDASVMLTYGESAVAQGFHYLIYGPDARVPYAAAVFVTRQAVLKRRPQVIAQFMRAMAEAAKIFHTDRAFTYKVLAKYLRIDDPKIVDAVYRYEVKALEPRLEVKAEAIQAILDEVSASDPRAKNVSAQQLIDRHYLDEMDKSGFYESLWGKVKDKG